jgi:MFS family permease
MWHIIALSVWLGAANAVDIPTRQSFLVEMVDGTNELSNAIALNSSIVNVGRLVGPALGGLLTALVGVGACFLVNGFSFLAVIVALVAMRIAPRVGVVSKKHVRRDLADGFAYAFRFPPIRALLLIMALVSLVGIPYSSLLPVFAHHVLAAGPKGYGALMAGVGVGALVGAFYLASRSSVRGLGRVIAWSPALLGAGLVAFALSRSFALSLMLTPFLGLGQILLMASCNTVLQTIVEDDMRGRVMAFYSLSFLGMMPLGNLLAGVAARQVGPSWTIAVGGVLCIAAALRFSRKLPELRRWVRPIYVRKGIIPEVASGLQAAVEHAAVRDPGRDPGRPQ